MVQLCLVSLERFGGALTIIELEERRQKMKVDMSFRGTLEMIFDEKLSLEEHQKSAPSRVAGVSTGYEPPRKGQFDDRFFLSQENQDHQRQFIAGIVTSDILL